MRRLLFTAIMLIVFMLTASAQTGLHINEIFNGKYASDPKVTETIISGTHKFLKGHDLTVFATFKGPASVYRQSVEQLVLSDGAQAIGKNVRYKDGKLYFALFILKPITEGKTKLNRYLYYLNNATDKGNVLVVYLEGSLSDGKVTELIQSLTKKNK
ncbi:MAG: hypothetical protein K2J92_04375 [Muribaculaceae bacterium]|nr:hypothetical protein [Muribaculaceae bacterium]MDE6804341.1 hypothetical protein [Muribaculaceae bacterium]